MCGRIRNIDYDNAAMINKVDELLEVAAEFDALVAELEQEPALAS